MLMENRIEDSHGAVDAKESRSLDLQTLYDQNPGLPERKKRNKVGSFKRKHATIDDGTGQVKKKSKKELPQNGAAPTKRSKKSLDGVSNGGSNKVENGPIEKPDDKSNGFGGTSPNQGNGIAQIPKRRRAVGRRKEAHVINDLKQEETLSGKVSSSDVAAELNDGSKGCTDPNGGLNGQPGQEGDSKGSITGAENKAKQRKLSDDKKENILSRLNLLRLSEKELANSLPFFGDLSSNKKPKRNRKKKKEAGNTSAKDTKPNQSTGPRDNSVDDDEDNLEANAARMLSSRFDPSCTGFSSNGKCSDSVTIPSLGNNARNESNLHSESDAASDDADGRVLRPRNQQRRKVPFRKRRHFYEVLAKDVDAHWMVQRKIKVYWPLDQFWYFGKVIGYDSETMLHHIKYDDREEEWIDLQNERIKLLLFPSELPSEAGRRVSRGKRREKEKPAAVVQDDCATNSQKDSEPIISWLERPSSQMKFPSSGITKTSQLGKAHPPASSLSKSMDVETLESPADILVRNTAMPNNSLGREVGGTSHAEINCKTPIVYFRRRFRRKKHGDSDVSDRGFVSFREDQYVCGAAYDSADSRSVLSMRSNPTEQFDCSPGHLVHVSLPRSDDDVPILSLSVPVLNTEIYTFKLNLLPFMAPYYSFGVENLWLSHATLMLQHGTLMTLWPSIHLEMIFVDNLAGLRFLLFEGGLVQAIALVFSVLDVFYQSNNQRNHVDGQLPVTSVRFQFSFSEDVKKQLVFALCDFHGLETSKWASLDHMFQKICSLVKLLPPSECTYDNIRALGSGHDQSNPPSESQEPTSRLVLQRRTRRPMIGSFASVIRKQSWVDRDDKWARVAPFAFSSSAAPTFFASLHHNLLTGCSISHDNFKDHNSVSLPGGEEQIDCCPDMAENGASAGCGDAEMPRKPSQKSQIVGDKCLNKGRDSDMTFEQRDSPVHPSSSKELCPSLEGKTGFRPVSGITVELPSHQPQERPSSARLRNGRSSRRVLNSSENAISSPGPSGPRKSCRSKKIGKSYLAESLSKAVRNGKPDLLCTGPRKPRTQVSYSLPLEVDDVTTKSRTYQTKGFSRKRIRRASGEKEPDTNRNDQGSVDMETLSCDVNVLVIMGDKGWREDGARVELELVDDNEWRLAVKISESTRYSYKASQFLLSGSTNRFTHAMMWKGGKDWILEFPDRSQWALFKELHEECYNRNLRAASVKNIPIPGVRLIEENDDNGVELPFVRPSPKYYQQSQTDVEIAMDPLHVVYDMDSDDELWISKLKSSDVENRGSRRISDELFEKIMDTLEKVAYANQQDQFTPGDLEELSVIDGGSVEAIKIVYEHWLEKRKKKGMPLIRHLQPPLWEIYQQKVQEWESAMPNNNGNASNGSHDKPKQAEKPPMFAFCLKPRGLESLNCRGTKHRSHKKLHANGHSGRRYNGYASGDEKIMNRQGSFDSSTMFQPPTRLLSPRNAGGSGYTPSGNNALECSHNPRHHRNKSKKIDTSLPNQRFMGWRNGMQAYDSVPPEWHDYKFRDLDPAQLDDLTLRDAIKAAKHTVNVAKLKRVKAQKMLYKADLAIQKASSAMMLADAIKASSANSTSDASSEN